MARPASDERRPYTGADYPPDPVVRVGPLWLDRRERVGDLWRWRLLRVERQGDLWCGDLVTLSVVREWTASTGAAFALGVV